MDLAQWFVAPEHPLTARVAVNRFWQQLFGVGIVKTSEDFGPGRVAQPSRTARLPGRLVHRVGVGRQSADETDRDVGNLPAGIERIARSIRSDPENRLLSRGSRFRMDSEMIRDQVLATSGLLNDEMYGKSVKPPQPAGLWETVSMPSSYPRVYEPDTGDKIYRRSVYTFWKRGMPPPQMTILNAPSREACIARRERTNTPLQALLLMNEPEYLEGGPALGSRDDRGPFAERCGSVGRCSTRRLRQDCRTPRNRGFLKLVEDLETIYRDNPNLADQLCEGVQLPQGVSTSELAAWTMLVSTIYNLDITRPGTD